MFLFDYSNALPRTPPGLVLLFKGFLAFLVFIFCRCLSSVDVVVVGFGSVVIIVVVVVAVLLLVLLSLFVIAVDVSWLALLVVVVVLLVLLVALVVLVVFVDLGTRREAEHRAAQLAFREADLVKEVEAQRRRADETFLEIDVR